MRIPQKKVKKKKVFKTKLLVRILFFLFILGLVILIAYYLILLATNQTSDPTKINGSHQYLLSQNHDDTDKTLIVFENEDSTGEKIVGAYILEYNKNKGESIVVYIPGWLYFAGLEENFGNSIAVSSFKYAGDFLQEGRGVEYAIWQLSQMVGIKFDNYIWFTPEGMKTYSSLYGDASAIEEKFKENYKTNDDDTLSEDFYRFQVMASKLSFLKNMFNLKTFKTFDKEIYSNLSFGKVVAFMSQVNAKITSTETYGIDLGFYRYSTESLSASGGQIRYMNTGEFDTSYRELLSKIVDRSLEKERVRIEVYNGSGVAGAAKQFGRKIENSGCDVVRYENAPKTIDKTVIYIPNKSSFSQSLEVVSEILSGSYNIIESRPDFMTTGDIVIVLGQDIKQMYSF